MADDEAQSSRQASQNDEHSRERANIPQAALDEQLVQTMISLFQRVAENIPPPQPVRAVHSSIVKEVHKYRAEEFRGLEDDDPTKAEYWLEQLERILGFMDPTPEEKLQVAAALLKDEAYRWWISVLHVTPKDRVNWEFFLKEFMKRYVGEQYMEDRKREFLQLTQGDRTVQQYEIEF